MRTTLLAASLVLAVLIPATHVAAQSDPDKSIALEIGNQLKSSGQLRDYRIGVKYKDGIAALSGTVTNQQQLNTAVHLTQQMRGVDQVVNNLKVATPNPSLTKPAAKLAARASYTGPGPQNEMASRTSYQQQGPGPQQGFNPQQGMGPMGQQGMAQQPMYRQNMGGQNMAGQNMSPMGPQRQMNAQQGRGNNMPRPMGRPQVQQAMMAQQQQQQMQAMQAGCNCGPGGMGGGMDMGGMGGGMGGPPMGYAPGGQGGAMSNDNAQMPGYAWPSYASYPNYAAVSYPKQYSPSAWPYIGPFYPYPQVPLGWRKVCLEWDDGWWFLDFSDCGSNH